MSMPIYIVHYHTVPLMRSVHQVQINRCVFSRWPNLAMLRSGSRRSLLSAFQTVRSTTA